MDELDKIPDYLSEEEIPDTDIEYYENGNLKRERITVTEKLIKEVLYSESGLIKEIIDYDDLGNVLNRLVMAKETAQNGLSFTYYPNGNVQTLKYFINGKINWVEKVYAEDGQLLEVISYNKGIKSGTHTVYSKRNAKLSEVTYSGNKPDGKAKYYYETGELKAEISLIDGKKSGEMKYFHKNGILRKKENFKDGIKNGPTSFYYENGALKEKWNYDNGELNDESLKFDMSGQILKRTVYSAGEVRRTPLMDIASMAQQRTSLSLPKTQTDNEALAQKVKDADMKPIVKEPVKIDPVLERKRKVKLAIGYTGIFFGSLLLIYIIYNIIIYFAG